MVADQVAWRLMLENRHIRRCGSGTVFDNFMSNIRVGGGVGIWLVTQGGGGGLMRGQLWAGASGACPVPSSFLNLNRCRRRKSGWVYFRFPRHAF